MAMASTTNFTSLDDLSYWFTLLNSLNVNISRYGLGLIWLVGNVGSIANCLVFGQAKLLKHPCVMYFLASSMFQLVTFNFALLTRMLYFGFNIQTVNTSSVYCKIRYYIFYIAVDIPRFYIVLASIDRYFVSSLRANWRRCSSRKTAWRLIMGNFIFWCIIHIQILIFYEIQNGTCSFQNGTYSLFFSIYLLIESGIIPPVMILLFGLLTLNNIRQSRRRTNPISTSAAVVIVQRVKSTRLAKKDLHFSKMLFNQICLMTILNLINPCYLLYRTTTMNDIKTPLRLKTETSIDNISYLLIYLEFALTFFVYTLTSSLFRRELNNLICKVLCPRVPSDIINSQTRMSSKRS